MKSKCISKLCNSVNDTKSTQCFNVDLYAINKSDIEDIFKQLESIEKTIGKLNAVCDENIGEDDDNKIDIEKYGKATINLKILKIFNYNDYPSQLLNFYFVYQYFFSTPSFVTINEYYECMAHFNGRIPEYLACAIMSKSSLYSPCSQLYRKNLEYSDYYYELSVKYLNAGISKNEVDIYMLYALSILSWIDDSLNRQFSKFSRAATSTKLAQILGLDSPCLSTESKRFNITQHSLKKLLLYIKYYNNEISKVFNLPRLNICKELEFDYYEMRNEEKDTSFINHNIDLLPKEYYLVFKAQEYYLNLKYTHIDELERNLYSKNVAHNFKECFKLIKYVNQKYYNLPYNIKYSKECLNSEKILKSPLLNKTLRLYQLVLKQISVIYELLVRIIHKSSTSQIAFLAQNISIFFDTILSLLKDQQFSILKSSRNSVRLDSPSFFYYGSMSLDLIEKLNQELRNRKSLKLKNLFKTVVSEFDSYIAYISNLQSDWEGSDKILKLLTERYKSIKFVK